MLKLFKSLCTAITQNRGQGNSELLIHAAKSLPFGQVTIVAGDLQGMGRYKDAGVRSISMHTIRRATDNWKGILLFDNHAITMICQQAHRRDEKLERATVLLDQIHRYGLTDELAEAVHQYLYPNQKEEVSHGHD